MSQDGNHQDGLTLTAVLCTYNPRRDILAMALDAVDAQTMPKRHWQLIVVDNNSSPALTPDELNIGRTLPLRLISEPRLGNVFARRTALAAARSDLLMFVDDDNLLDANYFETAVSIAAGEPAIGAFGGISIGVFEGGPPAEWKKPLLGFLGVRDYGPAVQTSVEDRWGEWEPIGAGMVFRRAVASKYIEMVDSLTNTHALGRKGKRLMAGEDSLLARASYRLGYACSYQPELRLRHYIKSHRLTIAYLARLLIGHGRSAVNLNRVLGIPSLRPGYREMMARLIYRVKTHGRTGLLWWCWDIGYLLESRKSSSE